MRRMRKLTTAVGLAFVFALIAVFLTPATTGAAKLKDCFCHFNSEVVWVDDGSAHDQHVTDLVDTFYGQYLTRAECETAAATCGVPTN